MRLAADLEEKFIKFYDIFTDSDIDRIKIDWANT